MLALNAIAVGISNRVLKLFVIACVLLFVSGEASAQSPSTRLTFEANQGQSDPGVKFVSRGRGYGLSLTSGGAQLALAQSKDVRATVGMRLVGSNPDAGIAGLDKLNGISNYILGNDPQKWYTGVPNYARVQYSGIYPGVDLIYYGNQGQLEYDFVVRAGADFRAIKLGFEGIEKLGIDRSGDLLLRLNGGVIRLRKPVAYQEIGGTRHAVESRYVVAAGRRVGFQVGKYDQSRPLVLDPVLTYSSFISGGNFDFGTAVALDSSQNAYVVGSSNDSSGVSHAFIAKFDVNGNRCGTNNGAGCTSSTTYMTYFGGNGADNAYGVAVDSSGNAYVTGDTYSTNLPTTTGAYKTSPRPATNPQDRDAFVAKFNSSGALSYSTYLGGSVDETATAIALDSSNRVYVTGYTTSSDFPTTTNAFQSGNAGGSDAFVASLSLGGNGKSDLTFSTYLGGSGNELGRAIAVDSSNVRGNAYITGSTASVDFRLVSPIQATFGGGVTDAFVAEISDVNGTPGLFRSTYLGGPGDDVGYGIALDSLKDVFVTGSTSGSFPNATALPAGWAVGNGDAFVAKLNPSINGFLYSNYLGGSGFDAAYGIAVTSDGTLSDGTAYVTGQTSSPDFPVVSPVQATHASSSVTNAFVSRISPAGDSLQRSTALGGTNYDIGSGIAVNAASGNIYVTGQTASFDFPVAGPFGQTFPGVFSGFITSIPPPLNIATLATVSVPSPINGGTSVTGTVTITRSGSGNVLVTLGSNDSRLTLPSATSTTVSLTGNQTSATFTVTAANDNFTATVTATLGSVSKTAVVTVSAPAQLTNFGYTTDSSFSIVAGTTVAGGVSINTAQSTSTTVTLTSSDPAHVPVSNVTVPAGSTHVDFNQATNGVNNPISVTVWATILGAPPTCTTLAPTPTCIAFKFTLSPPVSLSFNPNPVTSPAPSTGTVTVSSPVVTATIIPLSSSPAGAVPVSVTITTGNTSATFPVNTAIPGLYRVTATLGASSAQVTLTVNGPPPQLTSLTLAPNTLAAGGTSLGTVTISPAQVTDTIITLSSNDSHAGVPGSVTITAASTSATFIVTTTDVDNKTVATITAKVGTSSLPAALTINPIVRTITAFSFSPSSVTVNQPSTGTVTLSSAVTLPTTIALSSSPAGAAPASVIIPIGSSSASFPANTSAVGTYNVTATLGGPGNSSKTAALTVSAAGAFVPFAAFTADVNINLHKNDNNEAFDVSGTFTTGVGSNGIRPDLEAVKLKVSVFMTTIPAGSFKLKGSADTDPDDDDDADVRVHWIARFKGTINGVDLKMHIRLLRNGTYPYAASGKGIDLTGAVNPVPVELTIGDDKGVTTDPKARIK